MTRDPEILLQAENQYPNEENKKKIRAKYAKLKKLYNFTFQPLSEMALGPDVSPLVKNYSTNGHTFAPTSASIKL